MIQTNLKAKFPLLFANLTNIFKYSNQPSNRQEAWVYFDKVQRMIEEQV